ncbi:MAG: DUF6476 family protein [Paracoccaceae bacterium]
MTDPNPKSPPDAFAEPPRLRLLRWLVTGLTATLIVGVLIIVGLLVTFVRRSSAPAPAEIPEEILLPAGETALAFTRGTGWFAVVTRDGGGRETIRIFSRRGKPLQTVPIRRPDAVD